MLHILSMLSSTGAFLGAELFAVSVEGVCRGEKLEIELDNNSSLTARVFPFLLPVHVFPSLTLLPGLPFPVHVCV